MASTLPPRARTLCSSLLTSDGIQNNPPRCPPVTSAFSSTPRASLSGCSSRQFSTSSPTSALSLTVFYPFPPASIFFPGLSPLRNPHTHSVVTLLPVRVLSCRTPFRRPLPLSSTLAFGISALRSYLHHLSRASLLVLTPSGLVPRPPTPFADLQHRRWLCT